MQREDERSRYVEEVSPDGVVVIYDSRNTDAWIQTDVPADIHQWA